RAARGREDLVLPQEEGAPDAAGDEEEEDHLGERRRLVLDWIGHASLLLPTFTPASPGLTGSRGVTHCQNAPSVLLDRPHLLRDGRRAARPGARGGRLLPGRLRRPTGHLQAVGGGELRQRLLGEGLLLAGLEVHLRGVDGALGHTRPPRRLVAPLGEVLL